MPRSPREHPEYPHQDRCTPPHRSGTKNAPYDRHRHTDISVQVPFHVGIIPPPLMVHPLDHMASDPLRQGRKDHTAEKQPDSMQFPADNNHRGSRNTVKNAERPIHETSVYKPSLPHCRCHRLEYPAEKAERKEQPQSLKSCIPHILYLSSPDFSFVFPEALPHFCICSPEYCPPLFHSLIFHPASIKSRTCIQIFYHISLSYRIYFFYFVFSIFSV